MNTPQYIGNAQAVTDGCGSVFGNLFGASPAYRTAPTKKDPAPVPVPAPSCPDPGKPDPSQDGAGLTAIVRISGAPVGAYVDAYGDTIVPVGKDPITIVFEPRG